MTGIRRYKPDDLDSVVAIFRPNIPKDFGPGVPLVMSTSQHTQGFYEKFGLALTEHTPNGLGPGVDICKMMLDPTSDGIASDHKDRTGHK